MTAFFKVGRLNFRGMGTAVGKERIILATMTLKELDALESQLTCEQTLVKKFVSLATSCTDPQLKAKFQQIAARHQDHFNRLLKHLS